MDIRKRLCLAINYLHNKRCKKVSVPAPLSNNLSKMIPECIKIMEYCPFCMLRNKDFADAFGENTPCESALLFNLKPENSTFIIKNSRDHDLQMSINTITGNSGFLISEEYANKLKSKKMSLNKRKLK